MEISNEMLYEIFHKGMPASQEQHQEIAKQLFEARMTLDALKLYNRQGANYKCDDIEVSYHIPPVVEASLRILDTITKLKDVASRANSITTMVSSDIGQQAKDLISQRQDIYKSAMKHVQDYLKENGE